MKLFESVCIGTLIFSILTICSGLYILSGCGGGTASYASTSGIVEDYHLDLKGKCYFLEKVEHGFMLDCQGAPFFLETDYAEPVKYWDEFELLFKFEPVEDGLYVLIGVDILTHYSW